ncbi:low specificity L-threonine aldolase [Pelomonas sp. KK5]|uniref:threonine aldolase family protein n=1 Tax=Pelomonas sp. KK5 TaxID=1855730 RepID=UPI00097C120C|nr:beta-eliminating lyase-related protein [Pelomonas sp. KK5]
MDARLSAQLLLKQGCRLHLPGFKALEPADEFEALARWCAREGAQADVYGEGGLAAVFEQRIAALLGKPAAVFMPSGVMAQLIAMRIYTERAGLDRFGLSPNAHLALHEQEAPQALFGLHAVPVGSRLQPMTAEDLAAQRQRLAAVVVELPMREAGGQLPDWDALQALKEQAAAMATPLHMDGARLWQCRAFYQRSFAEIAAGFASVYVSMYKDIGGMAGAVLAGEEAFIAEARLWQRRMGGNLYQQTPLLASAMLRFDARLALLDDCWRRAKELASLFGRLPGVRVNPAEPRCNMFHLQIDAPAEALNEARDAVAREEGAWLFGKARPMDVRGFSVVELTVGDQLLAIDDATVERLFRLLLERASP